MIKDSLTLYEELIAAGVSDAQAKVQAHQLGSVNDGFIELKEIMKGV